MTKIIQLQNKEKENVIALGSTQTIFHTDGKLLNEILDGLGEGEGGYTRTEIDGFIDEKIDDIVVGGDNKYSISLLAQGGIVPETAVGTSVNNRVRAVDFTVFKDTSYRISPVSTDYDIIVFFYDKNEDYIYDTYASYGWNDFAGVGSLETPTGTEYIKYTIRFKDDRDITTDDYDDIKFVITSGNIEVSYSPSISDQQQSTIDTIADNNTPSTGGNTIYHTGNKPTASDIGALPVTDTMPTGQYRFSKGISGSLNGDASGMTRGALMYALDYQNRVAGGLGSIHGSINPSLFQACRPNTAATGVVATIDNITTTPSKLSLNTGKLIYSQALSKQYDADETITLTDYEVYHEGNKPTAEDVGAQAILTKVAQTATSVTATKNTKNVWSSSVSTLTVTIPTLGDNDEIELIFPLSSSGTFTLSGVSSHKWCNEVEKGKTNRVVVENGYITVGQYE